MSDWISHEADRDALADHVQQACNGASPALPRPATVVAGVANNYGSGAFPLVEVIFDMATFALIPMSQSGAIDQDFSSPGRMIVRISTDVDGVFNADANAAERELFKVHAAIIHWFSVLAHRSLPDGGGNARCQWAGPPFATKGTGVNGPYTNVNGQLRQALAFGVTFLGFGIETT